MLRNIIYIMMATLLLFLVSCDETTTSGDYEIIVTANAKVGDNVTITVAEKDKLVSYKWALVYELGNSLTSCSAFNTPEINCTIEEGGEVTIWLRTKNRNGDEFLITKKISVLDMDKPLNQPPLIVASLNSASSSEAIVSTQFAREKGVLNFPVNEEITFEFSETTDDTTLDNTLLKYEIEIGSQAGFQVISNPFKYTFTQTGYYTTTLRVTDEDGNSATKTFVVYVKCADNSINLQINPALISITADSINNFFTYSASGAVSGGDETHYRYRWDYNGDGIYDSDWLEEASIREYTVFEGSRDAKLKVWEQQCNNVSEVVFEHNFVIPLADAVPGTLQGPQIPGYFFIQGYPEGKDNFQSKITEVDFIATKHDSAPVEEQWRVLCDYRPNDGLATISIKGLNQYEREGEDGELHGVLLTLDNIDISSFPSVTTLSNVSANVANLNYYSDEDYDKTSRVTYRKDGDCTSTITIEVLAGEGSCSNGSSTFSDVIIIDGTYSCDNLKGTNDENISFKRGAFYCEVGKGDACIGGGGGGGGNPPEEF
ncbi:PKD domain-containing protein [bacterium]|nr:PKD domain-containing protein [bacterium]